MSQPAPDPNALPSFADYRKYGPSGKPPVEDKPEEEAS